MTARQNSNDHRDSDHDSIIQLLVKMEDVKKTVDEVNSSIKLGYVTKEEFEPYKKMMNYVLYIMVGAVVTAITALAVRVK